jgi:hypothetical protein
MKSAIELIATMGWIKSRETYARFMMKRFVRFLAERGVTREGARTGILQACEPQGGRSTPGRSGAIINPASGDGTCHRPRKPTSA